MTPRFLVPFVGQTVVETMFLIILWLMEWWAGIANTLN